MTIAFNDDVYLSSIFDQKPEDLVVLDLRKHNAVADFFVICHGKSSRQVISIAERIKIDLKKYGIQPFGSEGISVGSWAVLDYGSIVMHIFQESFRSFYDLEGLWSDARSFKLKKLEDLNFCRFDNSEVV